jgi:hypothetical protein
MSDLLNSASLVLIPSGYKEDVVYSAVPTDGSGDLSFTRASNGTRVNSAGLVEVCPWNLVQQSETFDNAIWTKDGLTVTTNTTVAPNGTTTADTFTEGSASGQHRIYQVSAQSTNIYTISVYVKNITGTRQAYIDLGPVTGFFNFASETTYSASGIASFENVGNGWYRFSLTTATAITPSTIYMGLGQSNNETYTGNGTSAIAFWGAQLNIGATAKPYFPTTDRLNVPRLTYQNGGGGCPSLLLEKQSTNLYLYSEQLNLWSTVGSPTITANDSISPDGTTNADRVQFNASTNLVYNGVTGSAGTNVLTVYAKAKSGTAQKFRFFANGTINFSSDQTATDQWQRFEFVFTYAAVTAGLAGASTGASDVLFWGFQHEVSSYPTSYIPTTSASATRVADACSKTGISSLIGQTEGVVFLDWVMLRESLGVTEDYYTITLNNGTGNTLFAINNYDNRVRFYYFISGSLVFSNTSFEATSGQRLKMAFAYKQNDFAVYINGNQIATSSSGNVAGMSGLTIGSYVFGNYNDDIQVNQVALFPTRLTNAELASLTTL